MLLPEMRHADSQGERGVERQVARLAPASIGTTSPDGS
jgi:hypothetical protein